MLLDNSQQRIPECKEHRQTNTDDEGRVDQAEQQEYLGLQLRHQFRLARRALQEA